MLVNEYKLYVSIQKSSKDAIFGQCLYLGVPFVMSRTDAQNGVDIIFKCFVIKRRMKSELNIHTLYFMTKTL